jgi:hypothetical protein
MYFRDRTALMSQSSHLHSKHHWGHQKLEKTSYISNYLNQTHAKNNARIYIDYLLNRIRGGIILTISNVYKTQLAVVASFVACSTIFYFLFL